jgi:hypothetical protein
MAEMRPFSIPLRPLYRFYGFLAFGTQEARPLASVNSEAVEQVIYGICNVDVYEAHWLPLGAAFQSGMGTPKVRGGTIKDLQGRA